MSPSSRKTAGLPSDGGERCSATESHARKPRFAVRLAFGMVLAVQGLIAPSLLAAATITMTPNTWPPGGPAPMWCVLSTGGAAISAVSLEIAYDPTKLTFSDAYTGAAGNGAGKQAVYSSPQAGVARIAIYGLNQTLMGDGQLVYARFAISPGTPPGPIPLTLMCTASDATGNPVAITGTGAALTVGGCSLTCTAFADPSGGGPPLNVNFTSSLDTGACAGPFVYDWNFGDGSSHATTQNASHTYSAAGSYAWVFTVTAYSSADLYASCTQRGAVTVQKAGNTCTLDCTAAAPSMGTAGVAVSFASTATPAGCSGAATFEWVFGDGQTSTAQNPTHSYAMAGTYGWSLAATVQDVTCVKDGTITISPGAACSLACSATVPASGTAGVAVSLVSTATPSGCTGTPAFAWTFGDQQTSSTQNPSHTYAAAGSYNWSLVVSIQGVTCTKSGTIIISTGGGCTLSCTATVPPTGTAGVAISFASTATPSDCTGTTAFAWTFGDGQSSTSQNPSHTYVAAGSYTWTLVASIQGVTCTKSGTLTISTGGGGTVTLYGNDFESGTGLAGWDAGYFTGGNNSASDWRGIMACTAHGGSNLFRFGGSDCTATYAYQDNCYAAPGGPAGLMFPADATHARLSFWHRWEFESGYDGAMMRLSFDHQTHYYIPASAPGVWLSGGYTGTVAYGSGTRDMWTGTSTGYPSTFVYTEMDLDAAVNYALSTTTGAAGRTVWISFGGFSDSTLNKAGWYLDDVAVTYQGAGGCTLSCTATVPSSGTTGSGVSFASTATASGCTGTPAFAWVFGDGQTSSTQNPSHTYTAAGSYNWSLTVTVQDVSCIKSGTISVSTAASTNDLCADATLITGNTFSKTFSTAGFGVETGEPAPSCQSNFGATAWLRFTPSTTGRVTLATCSSMFDTVLALYSGGCGSWTPVTCNDDECSLQSQISNAIVNAGTAYLIQIAAYQGNTGTINFSFDFTPGLPPPPVISLIKKASPPFKLIVSGSNLQSGIKVYINTVEWTTVVWKKTTKIQLTGAIKTAVPKGTTKTFRFVNPDGGVATRTWGW